WFAIPSHHPKRGECCSPISLSTAVLVGTVCEQCHTGPGVKTARLQSAIWKLSLLRTATMLDGKRSRTASNNEHRRANARNGFRLMLRYVMHHSRSHGYETSFQCSLGNRVASLPRNSNRGVTSSFMFF